MNQAIAAAVVVFLIAAAWYVGLMHGRTEIENTPTPPSENQSTSTPSATNTTNNSQTTPSVAATGNESVTVVDQPAGSSVLVASVSVPQMGWVAVRDNNGHVLGAARVEAGTHASVVVPLLRVTESGGRYQVLLYTDDGDREYDLHKDSLLMRADASVVGAMFSAQ
ncbi:hypothetical protein COU18_03580 [Candidatus Kaiserbacteria bacterium CG10_big_fil_rev_8_21_14_0_10_51_14]|uniref:DUF7282 domain-containing protein n=1 Tax=Candidatus Kaiserbacteria bacterium CG10_big_fil_rev_8_21_14_0_10_51_14 TaxID=1974610 RepID=A0A2H0UBD5_9BACT|nr:MAG: hypothetical protein COU18_03580 [Candidatus Kaiserbacteria bacterium CG10_big_fil_rev_8_21_14_0_10_51_14]